MNLILVNLVNNTLQLMNLMNLSIRKSRFFMPDVTRHKIETYLLRKLNLTLKPTSSTITIRKITKPNPLVHFNELRTRKMLNPLVHFKNIINPQTHFNK